MLFRILIACALSVGIAACKPLTPPGATAQRAAPMSVADAQAALASQGYRPGPVDGVMGPRTRQALSLFQGRNGLAVTGRVDAATSAALRQAGGGAAPRVAAAGRGASRRDAERVVRAQFWPADLEATDLNGDGLTDYMATADYSSGSCGASRCSRMVLLNTGRGFRNVADILVVAIEILPTRTRGMRDLRLIDSPGNTAFPKTVRWNGRRYR